MGEVFQRCDVCNSPHLDLLAAAEKIPGPAGNLLQEIILKVRAALGTGSALPATRNFGCGKCETALSPNRFFDAVISHARGPDKPH